MLCVGRQKNLCYNDRLMNTNKTLSNKALQALKSFAKARILIVGDLMWDRFVWGKVERISPEAPIPIVHVQKETEMLGGAANVAHNVMALGAKAHIAGVLGTDRAGSCVHDKLIQESIGTAALFTDNLYTTTVKERIIAHSQQVVRIDRETLQNLPKVHRELLLGKIATLLPEIDILIIEDYGKGVICPKLLKELIPMANSQKIPVVVDPKLKHADCYHGVSVFKPNHVEAAQFSGIAIKDDESFEKAGRKILKELSCGSVLITRGEKGMAVFQEGKDTFHLPTQAKEVYDVSGAGDTVVATLAIALASGASIETAAYMANAAAGIVVGKVGVATTSQDEMRHALCPS